MKRVPPMTRIRMVLDCLWVRWIEEGVVRALAAGDTRFGAGAIAAAALECA
ncbi:MAG: hypothetical protein Fur0042_01190 [Cyanophyceae cyanobacterium]